jgi:hypothetical protein
MFVAYLEQRAGFSRSVFYPRSFWFAHPDEDTDREEIPRAIE